MCGTESPLVSLTETVTWGARDPEFAATPVTVETWLYACPNCHEEWYSLEASREHERVVWYATMHAMSARIKELERRQSGIATLASGLKKMLTSEQVEELRRAADPESALTDFLAVLQ
jgi:hypothetical protein